MLNGHPYNTIITKQCTDYRRATWKLYIEYLLHTEKPCNPKKSLKKENLITSLCWLIWASITKILKQQQTFNAQLRLLEFNNNFYAFDFYFCSSFYLVIRHWTISVSQSHKIKNSTKLDWNRSNKGNLLKFNHFVLLECFTHVPSISYPFHSWEDDSQISKPIDWWPPQGKEGYPSALASKSYQI